MAVSAGDGKGSKSPLKILANIFISFIGAGVLGLPYAFKEAGIIEGFIIMTLVAVTSSKAMMLIIDCKYKLIEKSHANGFCGSKTVKVDNRESNNELNVPLIQEETTLNGGPVQKVQIEEPVKPKAPGQDLGYGDVGYYAIGNTGRLAVEFAIVISQVGFCCAYLIFISENLSAYVPSLSLSHWLLIMLPPLAVLCLLRHLSSLALSSLFAQLSNIMAFGVVFWFDFDHLHNVNIHPTTVSVAGLPFFLAVSMYCYEGAGMILSLEGSLSKDIRHHFKKYFIATMVVVTTLYITFGACGYLSFGPETDEIITLNLPKGKSFNFAALVKSCLCLALFFTYPVMMFPVVTILEKKLIPNPGEKVWQGNVLRICMVLLSGGVVLAIPNFANLMALVGATCCTLLAFTLPGLFHLKIFGGSLTKYQVLLDLFLITIGVVGAVIGTADAMMRLHSSHSDLGVVTSVNDTIFQSMSSQNVNQSLNSTLTEERLMSILNSAR